MKLDVLIRTSQRKQDARSPAQQREICERCAETNGYEIAQVHDSGGSESGKTMQRASVQTALERVQAGTVDGVMVAFLDRLGRAPIEEAMTVVRQIHSAGGVLVPADAGGQPVKPDDPQAETNLVLQLQMARQFWLTTAKRYDRNRAGAIARGIHLSRPPLGYSFRDPTARSGGGVLDRRLVVNCDAPIVRETFERKAAGATWLELARWLDEAAPKGGRHWSRSSARSIITSQTYLGLVKSGEHVKREAHEPIVSESLWRRAQREPGRRTPRGSYLLSGLARCAGCGRTLRGSTFRNKRKNKTTGVVTSVYESHVYTCNTLGCTTSSTVIAPRLEAEVVRRFFDYHGSPTLQAVDEPEIAQTQTEIERLGERVATLAMVVPSHPKAVQAHQEALSAAEGELMAAERRLDDLLSKQRSGDFHTLKDDWDELLLAEQAEILREGIDAIVVRRSNGHGPAGDIAHRVLVCFDGDAPSDLLSRDHLGAWIWNDEPGSLRPLAEDAPIRLAH